jgi:hypothetical protein
MNNKQKSFLEKYHVDTVKVSSDTFLGKDGKKVTIELPYSSLLNIMDIVEFYEKYTYELLNESHVRGSNEVVNNAYERYQILLKLYQ